MKLSKRDRDWLAHFASGERETPNGMGPVGVSNFVSRKWMVRLERDEAYGPEIYRLTSEGLSIYEKSLISK